MCSYLLFLALAQQQRRLGTKDVLTELLLIEDK